MGQAADVRLGRQRAPRYEVGDNRLPYLRSANVLDGSLDLNDVKAMQFSPAEQQVFALQPGDVLVTEGSGSRETVGVSAVWNSELPGTVCFQNTLIRLRPRIGLTDGRFLAWWMRHARLSEQVAAVSSGANILHLSADGLKRLTITVPPLQEQRRIANFLDDRIARIDQVAVARQRQLAGVEHAFQARRRDAVLGRGATRVRGTELPWAPVIPEGWPVRRLSQLAALGTGHTPSRSRPELWVDCDVNWLTTSDVHRFRRDEIDTISSTEARISELGLANSAAVLHPKGTVALSRTASAGFSILMDNDMATSQDFVTWTPGPALSAKYLLHALRVMRPFLLGFLATGSTHKTIYFPDLMDLRIPVPDRAEQDEAVRRVEAVAESRAGARAALEREVDLLREYKQSLITAAVTGQIDVTTASRRIPGVS